MRIIGGEARGRVLRLPGGSRIRPTSDRVRESLFNILHPVEGGSFLDLFAGSGSVGLEALSRGARHAAFVEQDGRLVRAIGDSLSQFGFATRAEVIAADAERGLGRLQLRGCRFDVVFADPPYDRGLAQQTLCWPETRCVVAEGGLVVLQHSVREAVEIAPASRWDLKEQRRYGDTLLTFVRPAAAG